MQGSGGDYFSENREKQKKEEKSRKRFQEIMTELHQASDSLERAKNLFIKVGDGLEPNGLKEFFKEIGNPGKVTLREEMDVILDIINCLKETLLTHRLKRTSRGSRKISTKS